MKRRSIPLQTLHAFEATARHLSFTKAANELNLSQSAVSQQIQTLEYAVGVKLFVRMTRKIMLTKKGELFSREVRKSLELLDNAQDNLFPPQDGKQLSIVSTPSISSQWLIHKLPHFRQLHPDIEISIYQGEQPEMMAVYDADIGIFYGKGNWKKKQATKIYQDSLFPVCHPDLVRGGKLQNISDIYRFTLLSDAETKHNHWKAWFAAAGVPDQPISGGINFDNMSHMISAACQGQGVALVRDLLVEEELGNGRLLRLFNTAYTPPYATYFIRGSERGNTELINTFYSWMAQKLKLTK